MSTSALLQSRVENQEPDETEDTDVSNDNDVDKSIGAWRNNVQSGFSTMLSQNITYNPLSLSHEDGKNNSSYDQDYLHMTPTSIGSQDIEDFSELEMIGHDDVGSEQSLDGDESEENTRHFPIMRRMIFTLMVPRMMSMNLKKIGR